MAGLQDFEAEFLAAGETITAHTSGSTGVPKNIELSKEDMRRSARTSNAFFGIDESSVLACPLAADYIAGKMMVVRALEARCRLIELSVSNKIRLPDDIPSVDLLPVVPSQLASVMANIAPSAVRNLLIGGGAPSEEQCRALGSAGYKAFISYGMTETCSHVAMADIRDDRRIFHALPGIAFSVDVRGCLAVDAPDFDFRRVQTNDVVELIDASSFRWLGRHDNVINSSGLKLHPEEMERLFSAFLPDMDYYVVGEPDKTWGQAAVLVVEGFQEMADNALDVLRQSGIDHKYLPKRAVGVPMLQRTASRKIIRKIPNAGSY